jgi:hypothetical protein
MAPWSLPPFSCDVEVNPAPDKFQMMSLANFAALHESGMAQGRPNSAAQQSSPLSTGLLTRTAYRFHAVFETVRDPLRSWAWRSHRNAALLQTLAENPTRAREMNRYP